MIVGFKNDWKEPVLRVVLVMGPAGSGKSTYVADRLYDEAFEILDLYQFQESSSYPSNYSEILKIRLSYTFLEDALCNAMETAYAMEDGMRRMYDEQGIDWQGHRTSELIVIEGTYLKKARRADLIEYVRQKMEDGSVVFDCVCLLTDRGHPFERELIEIPTVEEGFSSVTILDEYEPSKQISDLKQIVTVIKDRDRIRENHYFDCSRGKKPNIKVVCGDSEESLEYFNATFDHGESRATDKLLKLLGADAKDILHLGFAVFKESSSDDIRIHVLDCEAVPKEVYESDDDLDFSIDKRVEWEDAPEELRRECVAFLVAFSERSL